MPPARMSRERAEQVVGAVDNAIRAGYQMGGMPSAIEAAARALNWPPYTVRDRLEAAKRWYDLEPIPYTDTYAVPEIAPISKPRVIVRASSAARPDGDPIRLTVIGDTHIAPGQDLARFSWFARHVAATKPDRVIQIGDLADLHSVSGHEKPGSAQQKAKPSFQQDLEATEEALALYRKEMPDGPPLHITEGNHEDRMDRWDSQVAETSGVLRMQWNDLMARYNVRQTHYRGYLFIGGCAFTHVPMNLMERPFNGRTINPIVNDLVFSCVWGHSHRFAYLTAPKIGPSQSIEALNVGCAAPFGWYPHYNVSEQGAYTWGIVECTVHGGHIINHRFITMVDLERMYGD
jgi:hypothetical protein